MSARLTSQVVVQRFTTEEGSDCIVVSACDEFEQPLDTIRALGMLQLAAQYVMDSETRTRDIESDDLPD